MTAAVRSTARHLRPDRRHRAEPRHEWRLWTVSLLVRFYRYEDGGPRTAVLLAGLFVAFAFVLGTTR